MPKRSDPPLLDRARREINGKYLPPADWRLAEVLFSREGKFVSYETLVSVNRETRQLRGKEPPENEITTIQQQLKRVRKVLKGTGYAIQTVYGEGLRLYRNAS